MRHKSHFIVLVSAVSVRITSYFMRIPPEAFFSGRQKFQLQVQTCHLLRPLQPPPESQVVLYFIIMVSQIG